MQYMFVKGTLLTTATPSKQHALPLAFMHYYTLVVSYICAFQLAASFKGLLITHPDLAKW